MELAKYQYLLRDCRAAIADDNMEKYFELLDGNLDEFSSNYNASVTLKGSWNRLQNKKIAGSLRPEEVAVQDADIRERALLFVKSLKPDDVSLLRRIHDRILVVACKNSPTAWAKIFNEAYFSHVTIIRYQEDIPEDFHNSDVLVLDDLECPVKNHIHFKRYLESLPKAHVLYVGKENPLKEDDPAEFLRCANANSLITVYARLRELLEFRKIMVG